MISDLCQVPNQCCVCDYELANSPESACEGCSAAARSGSESCGARSEVGSHGRRLCCLHYLVLEVVGLETVWGSVANHCYPVAFVLLWVAWVEAGSQVVAESACGRERLSCSVLVEELEIVVQL